MPEAHQPQVDPDHYQERYDHRRRFLSYWNQIDRIRRAKPSNLLEVGIGNGFVTRYLRENGFDTHSVDFDERLGPDTVASVLELPFEDGKFDVACCFETLEHLPYESFVPALRELRRVSRRLVLVSLPDVTPYFRFKLDYKFRRSFLDFGWDYPTFIAKNHRWDGQHYWEVGKRGYQLSKIEAAFREAGLELLDVHRDYEDPFHRFFSTQVPG